MSRSSLRPLRLAFLFALAAIPLCAQQNLTRNLLINPGAELGSTANWHPTDFAGNTGGTATVDTGTFDPGINPHTGSYDFVGHDGAKSFLSQTVYLGNLGISDATLDGGTVNASISFWEQGLSQGTPSDDASVTLTFSNGDAVLGSVTTAEVDSHTGVWQNLTGSYPIPPGTRYITYTMNFILHSGSDLDAFIDDNSLLLAIPGPSGLMTSPSNLDFGNQTVGATSAPQSVTLSNPSPATVNIVDILLELGANPADFAQTNNCPAALAPSASCQIAITFSPQGVGSKTAGVLIDDDATQSQSSVNLSGTGTGGILQVNPGSLKTLAGNGTAGYTGDGGSALVAELNQPTGVAFDPAGNLYIADDFANVVRKVTPTGIISTFAGNGTRGYSGDGGPATAAKLSIPAGVTSDAAGNIYIADDGNNAIRKVTPAGIITTFAGTGTAGRLGDGGPATSARLNQPQNARFDKSGNLFIPQCGGPSIRRVDTSGNISTVAGNFTLGFSGDGGPATSAQLNCPSGVAIDAAGNFYIADYFNQRIRKVNASGTITTIAGTGTGGFSGDGGPATAAQINLPNDIAVDSAGNLYIADSGNNRVRRIDTTGIITTVAGGVQNPGIAGVNTPLSLTTRANGNLVFSDSGNAVVRELFSAGTSPFPSTAVGSSATPQTFTLSNIGNLNVAIAPAQVTLSGNTADFSLTGGTCLSGATLTPAATCTLQVAFAPIAVGLRTVSVAVADTALNSPQAFTISGTGTGGTPTLTWPVPATIVFGTPLSGIQLNASATGIGTAPAAGTFTYTPPAGTILSAGPHTLSVTFTSTDPNFLNATATVPITVTQAASTLTWPTPAPIVFGTPLGATQLNASATGIAGVPVAGTFAYTPPAGTVLATGTQTLRVLFTPTDTNYTAAAASVALTVTQAVPTLTWPTPAPIAYGIPLGAAQLNATVLSGTTPVPGVFTYTPPAGTILNPGTQTLRVAFAPTDTVNFAPATGSVQLTVTSVALGSISPSTVPLGAPATTLTLNGSGFVTSSVVQLNGTPLATTYVNPTTLNAVVPATFFTQSATFAITVLDPSITATSAALPLTVIPATPSITVTGPSTSAPGSQPSLNVTITNPYPLDLTATFALGFASAASPRTDDPAIQFAAGGRSFTVRIPANSTVVPPIQLQAGTVAGTITIPIVLTAAGTNVTPASLGPVVIVIPASVPTISTVTLTRNTQTLSVAIHGFSNTREVTTATFHFVAAPGATVSTPDLTAPVTTPFTNWFTSTQSPAFGSTFTYTQVFNISDDAKNIGSVQVTLTNTVGPSALQAAQ